jgi:hypothetical protein
MLELIVLIHRETGTRRFQKTPEDTTLKQEPRAWLAPPASRSALRAIRQPLPRYVGFPPPSRLHLRHSLSRFDPRAHIGRSRLYI